MAFNLRSRQKVGYLESRTRQFNSFQLRSVPNFASKLGGFTLDCEGEEHQLGIESSQSRSVLLYSQACRISQKNTLTSSPRPSLKPLLPESAFSPHSLMQKLKQRSPLKMNVSIRLQRHALPVTLPNHMLHRPIEIALRKPPQLQLITPPLPIHPPPHRHQLLRHHRILPRVSKLRLRHPTRQRQIRQLHRYVPLAVCVPDAPFAVSQPEHALFGPWGALVGPRFELYG